MLIFTFILRIYFFTFYRHKANMIKQVPNSKDCTNQFLSTDQARLLAEHISKETKWDERDGIKTQTYSKRQKFGHPVDFPLWASMVAKKLYYEKAVDFIPNEVTVVEQDCHSIEGVNTILNKLSEVPGKAVAVVLEMFSGIKPGSIVTNNSYTNNDCVDGGRMMTVMFAKN